MDFHEEIGRLHFQNSRNFRNHIDAGCINASLQGADVGAIQFGLMSQFFLRQASGLPVPSQIGGECISYLHVRENMVLSSISPRSILCKT